MIERKKNQNKEKHEQKISRSRRFALARYQGTLYEIGYIHDADDNDDNNNTPTKRNGVDILLKTTARTITESKCYSMYILCAVYTEGIWSNLRRWMIKIFVRGEQQRHNSEAEKYDYTYMKCACCICETYTTPYEPPNQSTHIYSICICAVYTVKIVHWFAVNNRFWLAHLFIFGDSFYRFSVFITFGVQFYSQCFMVWYGLALKQRNNSNNNNGDDHNSRLCPARTHTSRFIPFIYFFIHLLLLLYLLLIFRSFHFALASTIIQAN